MKIAILGTGYVGLVAGAGFADFGHDVVCVDIAAARIESLCAGVIPFHEPGLAELVARNRAAGRLQFTTSTAEAVAGAAAVFIAVGTPEGEDGSADLTHVQAATPAVARHSCRPSMRTVLITSTTSTANASG